MSAHGDRAEVRAPVVARAILWLFFVLGLVLAAGAASDVGGAFSVWGLTPGVVFAVSGLGGALARARCDEVGIEYRNVGRWRVPVDEVVSVEVQSRGYYGVFPTLVIYRRVGRPVILRGVADYQTAAGWRRMETTAAAWRRLIGLGV